MSVTGITDPISAGASSNVTVTARDSIGNVASGYRGTIHFTSSDGTAVLPPDYAFVAQDNGTHTFTGGVRLRTPGEQTVTATDNATSSITGSQTAITVQASGAHSLSVTGISDPVIAGAASGVTVTARDSLGNVATGYTGTIHFTSSDGTAVLPADYTFVAGDNGVHTFTNGHRRGAAADCGRAVGDGYG